MELLVQVRRLRTGWRLAYREWVVPEKATELRSSDGWWTGAGRSCWSGAGLKLWAEELGQFGAGNGDGAAGAAIAEAGA